MDSTSRLLADVSSWYWWLTAVALSLLLNLLAAYIKAPIDRWIENWSAAKRAHSEAVRQQLQSEAAALVANPRLISFTATDEIRLQVQGGVFMLLAVLFMLSTVALLLFGAMRSVQVFGVLLFTVAWFLLQTGSFILLDKAQRKAQVLSIARQLIATSSEA